MKLNSKLFAVTTLDLEFSLIQVRLQFERCCLSSIVKRFLKMNYLILYVFYLTVAVDTTSYTTYCSVVKFIKFVSKLLNTHYCFSSILKRKRLRNIDLEVFFSILLFFMKFTKNYLYCDVVSSSQFQFSKLQPYLRLTRINQSLFFYFFK